jgi:hypothetical protein
MLCHLSDEMRRELKRMSQGTVAMCSLAWKKCVKEVNLLVKCCSWAFPKPSNPPPPPHTHTYVFNPLTPNDQYSGRTAPLTSKRCILYIYLTNIGTEYFQHSIYSPFFPLQNAVCFIILTFGSCIFHILYTGVLKLRK